MEELLLQTRGAREHGHLTGCWLWGDGELGRATTPPPTGQSHHHPFRINHCRRRLPASAAHSKIPHGQLGLFLFVSTIVPSCLYYSTTITLVLNTLVKW